MRRVGLLPGGASKDASAEKDAADLPQLYTQQLAEQKAGGVELGVEGLGYGPGWWWGGGSPTTPDTGGREPHDP